MKLKRLFPNAWMVPCETKQETLSSLGLPCRLMGASEHQCFAGINSRPPPPSQLLLFSSFPRGELCSVGKGEGRRGLHCTTPSGIFHILPPMMRPSTRRAETKDQDEDEGIVRNSSFGSPAKEGEEAKRRLLTRTLEKEKKKGDRRRRRRSTTEGRRGEGESHRSSLFSQLEEEEGTIYSPGRKH